ncbi:MAG TPA: bifunctional YncE family protein/alkaline phosphatase family protein [Candidatus Solibacter sp.]|nr:bifunctional YncE family protein/alkaline phosphatase family protein [Candidatus Solibacter sp.]
MTSTRTYVSRVALAAGVIVLAAVLGSQPAPRERVGPLAGGGFLLVSGWKIDPVGKQVPLDTLPMSSALTKDGKYLLVLNGGYKPPSISVIDTATAAVVSTTPVADAWLGLAISPAGDKVYVGGGSKAAVYEFNFAAGKLTLARTFDTVPGVAHAQDDFIGDVALSPDGHLLYAAALYRDTVRVLNTQSGMVLKEEEIKTGRRPYRLLFHPDGKSLFITHWADGSMGHYDIATHKQVAIVRIGAHASDMVWRAGGPETPEGQPAPYTARIFVAAANTNNVFAVGITPAKELNVVESINVAMTPMHPLGMTPSAVGLSADGKRLYVTCSDANAVAVVDIAEERSVVEGFIPTGWYPTAARGLANGTLVVLNGKGLKSYANNQNGPNPLKRPEPVHAGEPAPPAVQFVARMQTGTASWIPPFNEKQLAEWTAKTLANSPYRDSKLEDPNPLPKIDHVIYIVKENRTYDQVLGDIKEGNGDPSLVLFGENITPNQHKIAREFVLFDNFYVSSDVSADGHNWSTAAIANDYVQKMWPNKYANRRTTYDFEEQDPASLPPAGYLWTQANGAGVSMRNFGYMVNNKPNAAIGTEQITGVRDPILAKVTNHMYRGFDLAYTDIDRAKVFLAELAEYEKSGNMPRLILMRMGNDHTSGTAAGKIAPLSAAADNDQGVGMLIEGLSKSRFWTSTAVFILEDDAQNGADHVDSHRSTAYVVSPWVKHHAVDSTMYNTTSMLRTIEFLLGLRPMTHYDAGARPMTSAFQTRPDPAVYTLEKARISLTDVNPAATPAAQRAANLKLEEADENDDDEMNDILWRAIRKDAPPPPVRSIFAK